MKKYYLASILLFLIISCSKNDSIDKIVDKEEEVINLAPNNFDIEVINITHESVTINWSEATDTENDSVLYSIYLNQTLMIDGISELTYQFHGLSELTNYTGKVVAKDTNNNETEVVFSFQTEKYYLKYLKRYDYGQTNYGIGYASGIPYSMLKTSNKNYIIIGKSDRPDGNGSRFFVQKIDYQGNEIWKKFYDYQLYDTWLFKSTLTSTGFLVVGGHHLLNLDLDGNLIWYKYIDSYDTGLSNSQIKSVKQDSRGNIYLVGGRGIYDPSVYEEAVLTKLDNSGNLIWEKTYKNRPRNLFDDLVINSSDELIVVGSNTTQESEDLFGYWILKLNESGDIIWEKSFGYGYHGVPNQIIIKTNGNYAFVGYKNIFEVSPDGNNITNYPNFMTNPESIAETLDNGVIITGRHYPASVNFDKVGIVKYDMSGNIEWERTYSEFATYFFGDAVLIEEDGGYRIAGTSAKLYYYTDEKPNLLIYKTDPEGNYEY